MTLGRNRRRGGVLPGLIAVLVALVVVWVARATYIPPPPPSAAPARVLAVSAGLVQDTPSAGQPIAPPDAPSDTSEGAGSTPEPAAAGCPSAWTYWVLVPPLAAILLAILFRAVVPALVIGVLVGSYMMLPDLADGNAYKEMIPVVGGFAMAAEHYVVGAIVDPSSGYGHAKIIVFTMVIGFLVGVIGRNGGTVGMVQLVTGNTQSRRRGRFTAWLAGMLVFFDDYANAMIVGPTMQPVFDRLKIARAKLAYIVDSTAAPVASIFIGTWVGTEVGYIDAGLKNLTANGNAPAFLQTAGGGDLSAMSIFWQSIPYRFYALFALVAVFFVSVLGRDFGPMKKSESRAMGGQDHGAPSGTHIVYAQDAARPRWWLGVLPVLVLVGVTIAMLLLTGWNDAIAHDPTLPWWAKGSELLKDADAYVSIFYGSILAAIVAMVLTFLTRACSIRDAADAGLEGMTRISGALVILVLAWALSGVATDMKLGEVVAYYLKLLDFKLIYLPAAIFVSAALVSFATGTSWGTMGILTPMSVMVSGHLAADLPVAEALPLFYSSVGAVLAGAVFGDHCSPISDTTVLSSLASGCKHEEHVWTQMPYALVTAVVAVGCGNVVCDVYGQPWYTGLGAGTLALLLILLVFGRRPKALVSARVMEPPAVEPA